MPPDDVNNGNNSRQPDTGFTNQQMATLTNLFDQFATRMQGQAPPPPPPPPPPAADDDLRRNGNGGKPQFRPRDIGYFDPNPDVAPVETKDTYNVYHNVFSFTTRLRANATVMDAAILRENLHNCLLGPADTWWTNISNVVRQGLRYDPDGVRSWCDALEERFRDPPGKSLTLLEKIRYTVKDVRNRRDPADYVASIVVNGKNASIAPTEYSQVLLAYEHMDAELRQHLQLPKASATIDEFLEEIRHHKEMWFDLFANKGPESSGRQETRRDRDKSGQYQSNPFRSFPPRPYGFGGNGYGYGGAPRPYNGNQSPYARPFVPYGGNNPYASYQNNPINNQQQSTGGQRLQIESRQPLQITSGNANASPGQYQNQRQQPQNQQNAGNKNPFRPYGNNQQRRPFQRAYQADAENGQDDKDDARDPGLDEQAEYQAYEDAYYENVQWPQANDDENANHVDDMPDSSYPHDSVETHFIDTKSTLSHICRKCSATFPSNNALHRHLRGTCKKLPNAACGSLPQLPSNDRSITQEVANVAEITEDVIRSTSSDTPTPGYAFRGYHYVVAKVQLSAEGPLFDLCFDTGCVMSLIDRQFLRQNLPTIAVKKMPTPMTVKGIGDRRHEASEYVKIDMYLPGKEKRALIQRELHIVDNLSAKALIGIDIMKPEAMIINLSRDVMTIGACNDLEVPIVVENRGQRTQATVYSAKKMTIPAHSNVPVPITGPRKCVLALPENRDLFFEPHTLDTLSAYAHIVDHDTSAVFVRNDTDRPITLPRKQKLGEISELDDSATDCYAIDPSNHDLASKTPKRRPNWVKSGFRRMVAAAAAFSAAMSPEVSEIVHPTGVTIHGEPAARASIAATVEAFPSLWQDTGNVVNVPESEFMDIPLVDNWRELYKPGQARVYPLGQRDKAVIDEAFDKLHQQDRMEWTTTATPFSFPCFVVWKDTADGPKGRVVVDIRALNKITMPDAYPVPSQAEILAELRNAGLISTVDAASFFYQWWVNKHHRHRLTVASHRGQESFKVPVMGYRNSPAYVQRMIDRILRPFRKFCRAYVDDIVIFSANLEEHTRHLQLVFQALSEMNIHLSPKKSFLGYPSVSLLGQKVDALGLATATDKLAAIANLRFPKTLGQLDKYLGLTGYLRQYIAHYAAIAKPLQQRKVYLTRVVAEKGVGGNARKKVAARTYLTTPTPKELNAFHHLQKLFSSPIILVHFDDKRRLFIDLDASKEFGFGAHVYHSLDEDIASIPKQKSQQSILFLSRLLSDAETRYWPTELEIAGIVWVVKKIRHMVEAAKDYTIIYTDHSAAVSIVRQTSLNTTSIDKLNLRLVRASEYLQRFRLDVRYKPGKANIVPDALSRLASREYHPSDNADSLDALVIRCFPVSLVEMSPSFRQRLQDGYQEPRWSRVRRLIQENAELDDNAAKIPYRIIDDLLYFDDDERGLRLCIPSAIEAEVFKLAHDEQGHPGYARTHERLTQGLYIFGMPAKLHEFIRHCPHCQRNQTPRHRPYGSLQPIYSPARPFHTITIDFILALPTSPEGFDCTMSLTDKFCKAVAFIAGKSTWDGNEWAIAVLDKLAEINWGLPRAFISDRDRKFIGQLWKGIFKALNVELLFSSAWHPQTDGMSERSNQTAEIALRYYIATLEDPRCWPKVLPRMSASLNNSTKYSSTAQSPTQVLYGFRTREALDLLRFDDNNDASCERLQDPADTPPADAPNPQSNTPPIDMQNQASADTPNTSSSDPINPAFPVVARRRLQDPGSLPQQHPVLANPGARLAKMSEYRPGHIDAKDAIAFASLKMKEIYDSRHLPKFFNVGDLVHLRLHRGYNVPGVKSKKLGPQMIGPFKILQRIGRLAYKLELPGHMRIHDVVSIAHLEPATDPTEDPYQRRPVPPPPVVVDGDQEFVIEKLVNKRRLRRGRGWSTQYLIRWQGYGPEEDTWQPEWTVADTTALDDYERLYGVEAGIAQG